MGPAIDVNEAPGSALTAVLLHPHPDMGGDRFNHVVDALYHGLPKSGTRAVRFDFSSSDLSAATAEAESVVDRCGEGAVLLVGYSFGAAIALRVTAPRVTAWALVAPYLSGDTGAAAGDLRPKLLLVPERDQWSPPARVQALAEGWPSTTIRTLPGADHFLVGQTGLVVDATLAWLAKHTP